MERTTRKWLLSASYLAFLLSLILFMAGPAHAGEPAPRVIKVNSLKDLKANDGLCTLREAVIAANQNKASGSKAGECAAGRNNATDVIHLTLTGAYALTRTDTGKENAAQTGDLDIWQNVKILAQGHPTIINASKIKDRAFHIFSGQMLISGVTITGGNVKEEGGAIYNLGQLTLENSTLSGNKATLNGGAILNAKTGSLTLNFVTIAANRANKAGGLKNSGGKVYLRNTIIAGNTATASAATADCMGVTSSQGYNLFGSGAGCPTKNTDRTVKPATIFTSVFGALSTGGETAGLHALLAGSPAIDAGSPACPPPATDQRGKGRPQGAACDIGAYEAENSGQSGPIFTVNTPNDLNDGVCSVDHCSLREAIQAANNQPNKAAPDEIHFNLPQADAIQPTSALPPLTDPVILNGDTQPSPYRPVKLNGSQAGEGVDGLVIQTGDSQIIGLVISQFSGNGILIPGSADKIMGGDISGNNIIRDNMITLNGGNGVKVEGSAGNAIRGNRIIDNDQLGINLSHDGSTPNDVDDPDTGANDQQNFPVITRAFPGSGSTSLEGRLNSLANTTFQLEFFSNEKCDPADFGEGQTFLNMISVTTNISGNISFAAALPPLPEGHFVTATATDPNGNTSEFSQCAPTSQENDSWPRAMTLTPGDDTSPAVVEQYLDKIGQSRWYKFRVQPNSQVIVTLTDLPENYDLTVYKDIAAAFTGLGTPQDLVQLSAEFAPDAFSPDAFAPGARSPDAFAPGARSPDAFAPEAFAAAVFAPGARSPDAYAPGARSPDAFAPGARSPDIFAPDAFSPEAFAPGARSPDAIAPGARSEDFFTAFSSAQTRSLIGVSAFEGTSGEGIIVNTWNNTGEFYIRVRGREGAFSLVAPFQLRVVVLSEVCGGVSSLPTSSISVDAGGYETIILTDLRRMGGSTGELASRLAAFAPQVQGVVVDVHDHVAALNSQADTHFGCPYAKNLVAEAIREIVRAYRAENPLKYVVVVGNDEVIPFFRYPDNALLGNETDFIPPVLDSTASQASLRLGYVLGQDAYGSESDISFKASVLPIPDLAVGRLVETPEDVITILDAYEQTDDGVVPTPTSSFVSGYDFLEDAANAVQAELEAGIGSPANTLISLQAWSPADPRSWTAEQLAEELLGERHDIIFLAGHFSAQSALAADYTTRLTTADLLQSDVDLTNAIVFSAGCHSGYNVVNTHGIPQVTIEPDWAQAFTQKGALLIGGTGYQYGDTDFIEYGERLYLEFSRQLRAGSGPVSVGEALVAAKQVYMASTPEIIGLHEKSLLEAAIFGLPMLSVDMPGDRFNPGSDSPEVGAPTTFSTNPGSTLGLAYNDFTVSATFSEHSIELKNIEDDDSTVNAFYLSGGDGIVTKADEPILPLEIRNVSVAGTVLRGVGFRGGSYSDRAGILPLTGAPTTEIRGVHTPFLSDIFYPVQPWRANYFEALAGGSGDATRLMVTPAQFKSASPGAITGTLRRFNQMNLRLYYSNNLETFTNEGINSTPALAAAPMIVDIAGEPDNGQINFSARVVGDPSAGIQEVWVTYTAISGPLAGIWQSLDLSQDTADSTLWQRTLTLPPDPNMLPSNIRYIVQAVNGVGLVSMATNLGAYYTPGETARPTQATSLAMGEGLPTGGPYGSEATFSATLSQNGNGLAGQVVIFSLGPQSRVAVTGSDGKATATLPLLGLPDQYELRAAFPGNSTNAMSSAVGTFTITPQNTQLALESESVSGHPDDELLLLATLTDGTGLPLAERTVFFILEGDNETAASIPVITDYAGRARLGRLSVPFGIYNVTVYFNGAIALHTGNTITLNDVRYNPASPVTALLTLKNIVPVAANDSYETDEDVVLTVTTAEGVLNNDNDDGEVLTATLTSPPVTGTLSLEPSGAFTYTPALDFSGLVTFTYQADDGADLSNTATVSITVKPLNDLPLAVGDNYETGEDTPLTVAAPGLLANDSDADGDPLTAHLLASPTNGDLDLDSTGAFSYTPQANFHGVDTFVYQAGDGTALSSMATVTITVTPVNDPLVAGDSSVTTPEDTDIILVVTELITDIDSDLNIALLQVVDGPANGSTSVDTEAGNITYTPELDFNGTDVFTYQVSDGEFSDTGVVTIQVTPVNDPPVAEDDLATTDEDTAVSIDVLANDSGGPENEDQALTVTEIGEPANGTASLDETGEIVYTPEAEFSGEDSFTYTACDSEALCDTATVTVTTNPVNDAAPDTEEDNYTTDEDILLSVETGNGVLANDSDIDGDLLTASLVDSPAHGELSFNEDGSFTYMPEADFNGADSFTYQAHDGFASSDTTLVTIQVNPVNDAPLANDDTATTDENAPVLIDVLVNDTAGPADEDPQLIISEASDPEHGTTLIDSETQQISYTPDTGFFGEDSFTYTVCDSEGLCGTATVIVTVNHVNNAPVAVDDTYTLDENSSLTVDPEHGVLANDTDADNDPLTAILVDGPAYGDLTLNADGSFSYTPEDKFNGADSFTYQASDGVASSTIATVTLTVNPVDDKLKCSEAVANPTFIWPPNKSFVPVKVRGIDTHHGPVTITIDGIFQDEAVGKEPNAPDGDGLGTDTALIRAERNGKEDGRVYHIDFTAVDGSGSSCSGEVLVIVTHDERMNPTSIDGGRLYNSVTGEPN